MKSIYLPVLYLFLVIVKVVVLRSVVLRRRSHCKAEHCLGTVHYGRSPEHYVKKQCRVMCANMTTKTKKCWCSVWTVFCGCESFSHLWHPERRSVS